MTLLFFLKLLGEYAFYFIAFILSEKTVIDKYAGELLSDRFCK